MGFRRPRPLTTRPTVSVVIPCYNYGRFLPDAVASALDQRGVDVDVLVVDDASTDDSAEVALELARRNPRVDVLLHEQNVGHIQTYNDGLAKVRGDYVALLSADDLLGRDALTRAVALMEHHPEVGLVYGWARSFEGAPDLTADRRLRSWSVWSGLDWLELAARRGRCFLSSPEAVMRREALGETDGYDARLPHSGDFDMWLRTAARWGVGRVNGPVQAFYRVHDANMHLTAYAGWLTDLVERRRTFDILFHERAPDDLAVARLRPLAMHALAREAVRRAVRAHLDPLEPPEAIGAYLAYAAETDPGISRSLRWRLARRRASRGRGNGDLGAPREVVGRVVRFGIRVHDHLEWRRRRRFGT